MPSGVGDFWFKDSEVGVVNSELGLGIRYWELGRNF
jgi:hypothetical protein